MAIIGIDLGTSNSLAAVWRDSGVELIPNAMGSILTPSAVSIEENGTLLVGEGARARCISHPQMSASGFKRFMGTDKKFLLGNKSYTAEDLSSLVLRKLRQDAESYLKEPITEAVISVPAYFTDNQRAATKRAGQLAGLHVERLINEPSAAALTCRMYESDQDFTGLVFDFGGGTLDVSIVDCFDSLLNVLAVAGDNRLGGRDFDQCIAEAYCAKNSINFHALHDAEKAMLVQRAEHCKRLLSTQDSTCLSFEDGPLAGELSLTQQELINISAPLFQRMSVPIRRALADTDLQIEDISRVILVGGSCHMPIVRLYLQQLLQREIKAAFSPDTVVGLGAGVFAAIKEEQQLINEIVMTDVCPFSLGTSVKNHTDGGKALFSPIIQRNSVLPCRHTERYITSSDYQTSVRVDVYQGEQMYAADNLFLGELNVPVPPKPAGKESIDVSFTYDINGILLVEVTVTSSGKCSQRVLTGNGQLTDAQVKQRLHELQSLTLTPQDDERYSTLHAKLITLYELSTGSLREQVRELFNQVTHVAQCNSPAQRERELPPLQAKVERMEAVVQGLGVLPSDFSGEGADEDFDDDAYYDDGESGTTTGEDVTPGSTAPPSTSNENTIDGAGFSDSNESAESETVSPQEQVPSVSADQSHADTPSNAERERHIKNLFNSAVVTRKQ